MSYKSPGGGIFDGSYIAGRSDVSLFPLVPSRGWPPGPRQEVGKEPAYRPLGYKNIGMGDIDSARSKAIVSAPQPMDPQSVMVGRLPAYGFAPKDNGTPSGFTAKGGIFDGSTVDTGKPGGGNVFEEKSPQVVRTGQKIRVLPDAMTRLRNVPQESITPKAGPINGFGQAVMPSRPIPVSVSFDRPRMYGQSIFEGPVVRDKFPRESIMPKLGPINGLGAGPDGLGSDCGCGSWKTR